VTRAFLRSQSGAAAGLAAVVAIVHARTLFFGETFVDRDYLTFSVPNLSFVAQSLRAGRLPGWSDALGFGAPLLSNPQTQVFYPPTWLAVVLPVGLAADLLVLLHLFWAGLGMCAFSRRLGAEPSGAFIAGAVFLLGGYTSSMVVMGTPLATLAWLPWIAVAADRVAQADAWRESVRSLAWLAVLLAAAFLAGDPSGVITAGLVAVVIVLARASDWKRRLQGLLALLAAASLAVALAGVLFLPALYQLRETPRGGGLSSFETTLWSMHPWRFVEWIIPRAFGDQTNKMRTLATILADEGRNTQLDTTWASSVYLGFPLLLLTVLALRRRDGTLALAVAGLFFVALAMGVNTPIYGIYRKFVIVERVVRYPERHLSGVMMFWTALAGVGFGRLFAARPSRKIVLALAGGALALALVVLLERVFAAKAVAHFSALAAAADSDMRADLAVTIARAGALSALVVAVIVAAAAAARRLAPATAPWTPIVAGAALLVGFAVEARAVLPVVKRAEVSSLPAILEPLEKAPRDFPGDKGLRPRIYRGPEFPAVEPTYPAAENARVIHACAGENTAIPFGFAHVPGYQPGRTASARIERFFQKVPVIADAFDVRLVVMPEKDLPPGPKRIVARMPPMALVEAPRVRPRAYVAPRWSWRPTDDAALDGLYPDGMRDVGSIRLVGSGPPSGADRRGVAASRCGVEVARPEDILLRCNSPLGGYAVLLDEWAPGWTATVDGRPADIERVDALFKAVPVDAGAHEIRFRYATPGLKGGLASSLVGILLLLAISRRTRPLPANAPNPGERQACRRQKDEKRSRSAPP
jgi:hypothetical protein